MTGTEIIDTHLHLIYQDRLHYPWLAEFPQINRSFLLEEYRAQAAALGIERAVHMEVVVSEEDAADETDLVMGLGPPLVAAVAGCRPESEDFPATLDALAADTRVRGLRRILNISPDALGMQPIFSENIRRLAARDLSFDLCVLGRQLPIAERIAKDCPKVRFILDHCGMPDIAAHALDPWREGIRRISELPNVACKISGVTAYAGADWSVADLQPYVEHCINSFGWDRVVWGSDWPVSTLFGSLAQWIHASRELVAGCSDDEKARLFSRNAQRIYRLNE